MIKGLNDTANKDTRNAFRLKKENKAIKNWVIRYIRNLFEHEENYYKPVRIVNIWNNIYIEYKNKVDTKKLSIKKN